MTDQENDLETKIKNKWKEIETRIGKDPKDFIPVYGFLNYAVRAWPILQQTRKEPYASTPLRKSLYFGYMDKVFLAQLATSLPLAFATIVKVTNN